MKLFQTYHNEWAYRIPISYEDRVVKFIIAMKPMPVNWAFDKQDLRENEVDAVFPDSNITDLPRVGKMELITAIFVKGEYDL